MPKAKSPIIVWFRQDLRLSDNPAVFFAAQEKVPLIFIYIWDTTCPKPIHWGGATRWWLHHSLSALAHTLAKKGATLILRKGDPKEILLTVMQATHSQALFYNRCYEPHSRARDQAINEQFAALGYTVQTFNSSLLCEPWTVQSQSGVYFKVFTAFWRRCRQVLPNWQQLAAPKQLTNHKIKLSSDCLNDWRLLPSHPNWAQGFTNLWQPGENGAQAKLNVFLRDKLTDYASGRDLPAVNGTSHLSAHLRFGEISPWQIWQNVEKAVAAKHISATAADKFLAELGWREFAYHLLYHFPQLPDQPFRHIFHKFPWHHDPQSLQAWQKGQTGYPLVDAGMRELWQTGSMHNRVRMVVASFLTKHLLQNWRAGAAWFWDTLVDADLANNSMNWQWVAGCGVDAAPYFRIFNPILQSQKFDPNGDYIRCYVPELSALSVPHIHQPWMAPAAILAKANVVLGKTYPRPIVDHQFARERALKAYRSLVGE